MIVADNAISVNVSLFSVCIFIYFAKSFKSYGKIHIINNDQINYFVARCYGPDVESDVKQGMSIFYHLTRFCPTNGAAADEVTAVKYCAAPEPKLWKPGRLVGSFL